VLAGDTPAQSTNREQSSHLGVSQQGDFQIMFLPHLPGSLQPENRVSCGGTEINPRKPPAV
jgi:hypothetical protein